MTRQTSVRPRPRHPLLAALAATALAGGGLLALSACDTTARCSAVSRPAARTGGQGGGGEIVLARSYSHSHVTSHGGDSDSGGSTTRHYYGGDDDDDSGGYTRHTTGYHDYNNHNDGTAPCGDDSPSPSPSDSSSYDPLTGCDDVTQAWCSSDTATPTGTGSPSGG